MAKIELHHVGLVYQPDKAAFTALRDVSFSVGEGEFVSVIGPSGCGKSSLLKLLIGLKAPTSGHILLDGRPLSGTGIERSTVFQDYSLFPWMTVMKNITFALRQVRPQKRAIMEAKANAYLEAVGLTDVGHKFPGQLSGGMRQRVAIARALVTEPEILLMDEPFGAVDLKKRTELHELLIGVWGEKERKRTIVFITHDIDEAILLANRVIVLTQCPGMVKEEINVNLDRPRTLAAIKDNPNFIHLKNHILSLILD